jgi:peptidoglycan-associated lipoprotein
VKWGIAVLAVAAIVTIAGCKKKVAPAPPPPPPAPAPTASLTANPASVQSGQASTLTWTTQNATSVTLAGVGKVGPSGTQTVLPTESTTYRLTATGSGGTQEATVRVTVTAPPAAPPAQAAAPAPGEQELFASNVKDISFDYDSYDLRASDQPTLQADAAFLKSHPGIRFTIEGHCDERGSTEYNLALGENRANAVRTALVNLGVPAASIKTISYGKEKPFCTDHDEACYQQNRRAHFAYGQQ